MGKFLQLVDFIEILSDYSLPIILTDFSLQSISSESVQIDMQFLGIYIAGFGRSPGMWYSTQTTSHLKPILRDPFATPAVNNGVRDDLLSIHQMRYVGYLQQENLFWGLLMLPNGKTIHVRQGDILGLEKLRVVSVDEKRIQFENNVKLNSAV